MPRPAPRVAPATTATFPASGLLMLSPRWRRRKILPDFARPSPDLHGRALSFVEEGVAMPAGNPIRANREAPRRVAGTSPTRVEHLGLLDPKNFDMCVLAAILALQPNGMGPASAP